MTVDFVLDKLEQALYVRQPERDRQLANAWLKAALSLPQEAEGRMQMTHVVVHPKSIGVACIMNAWVTTCLKVDCSKAATHSPYRQILISLVVLHSRVVLQPQARDGLQPHRKPPQPPTPEVRSSKDSGCQPWRSESGWWPHAPW